MDNLICEKCGSKNVESGQINTSLGYIFTPNYKMKHQPKQALACELCKDCGHIQNFTYNKPSKFINKRFNSTHKFQFVHSLY